MIEADFALFNVDQLVTAAPKSHPEAKGELGILHRAALAAKDGKIVWAGSMEDFHDQVRLMEEGTLLNSHGRVVLPGFVDAHTHPVFAGDRSGDFYARALGATYAQQLETGGIMQTVRETRACTEDGLLNLAFERADGFLRHGTTTIGGKSGYGLTEESEIKCLSVLNRLQRLHPLKIIPTFLGAHVVPADYGDGADAYIDDIAANWLPHFRNRADFVDVWVDTGAFSADQAGRLLRRALDLGFSITAHASEMGESDGVRLAVELGASSVDHAVYLSDDDIAALASSRTVAVLLPSTTLFLGSEEYAPARRLIDAGATVAISTDFNPGTSYTQNMQFVMTLAILKLRMTPEEALMAATIYGARALGLEDRVGSLEVGKFCDLAVYSVDDYRTIPYRYATNLVDTVVTGGRIAVRDGAVLSSWAPVLTA